MVKVLFLFSPMERSLCSFIQVQTLLYLDIFSLSSGLALLCHPTSKKQGYFVLSPCCPRTMDNTFKSPHITHSCLVYLILSRILFIFSYVSFICIACTIGTEASLFPLSDRTHFRLFLELSMNSLHSNGV